MTGHDYLTIYIGVAGYDYLFSFQKSLKAAPEGTAFSVYLELLIDVEEPSEGLQSAC